MSDVEAAPRAPFKYTGDGTEYAILMLKNLVLTVITIGIYRAWATTNVRRYIWGHTHFMNDRGNYVGTGGELFRGWIKLLGLLFIFVIAARLLAVFFAPLALIVPAFYVVVFGIARYSGLRYRMSRTIWRQIRFGVDKDKASTREFMKMYLIGFFLSLITLGIYTPWFKINVRRYLTGKTRYGSAYFRFDGEGDAYAKVFFVGLILSILTLGIYLPWFFLSTERYRLEHTVFQGRRLTIALKGGDLLIFAIVGYFGTILTLGLASPWIINWGLRLFIDNISFDGEPDLSQIQARESDGSAMADDILAGYDIDLGI
jgi:uncharacterized membrane protein YjgN (DUF898 family)